MNSSNLGLCRLPNMCWPFSRAALASMCFPIKTQYLGFGPRLFCNASIEVDIPDNVGEKTNDLGVRWTLGTHEDEAGRTCQARSLKRRAAGQVAVVVVVNGHRHVIRSNGLQKRFTTFVLSRNPVDSC